MSKPVVATSASGAAVRPLAIRRLRSVLFGYDYFISYSQQGGKDYAQRLEKALVGLDLAVFYDDTEISPGSSLSLVLRWSLRRSRCLLVVGTQAATQSDWVADEIKIFAERRRPAIVIDLDDVRRRQTWFPPGEGTFRTDADGAAGPGEALLNDLVIERGRWPVNRLARWSLVATVVGLVALATAALIGRWVAVVQKEEELTSLGIAERHLATTRATLSESLWHRMTGDWNSQSFRDDQLNALWTIRSGDPALREVFQTQLAQDPRLGVILGKQPFEIIRAAGLRWQPDLSRQAIRALVDAMAATRDRNDVIWMKAAVAALLSELSASDAEALAGDLASQAAEATDCDLWLFFALSAIGVGAPVDSTSSAGTCHAVASPIAEIVRRAERREIAENDAADALGVVIVTLSRATEGEWNAIGFASNEDLRRPAQSLPRAYLRTHPIHWERQVVDPAVDRLVVRLSDHLSAQEAEKLLQPLLAVGSSEFARSVSGQIFLDRLRNHIGRRLTATQLFNQLEGASKTVMAGEVSEFLAATLSQRSKSDVPDAAPLARRLLAFLTGDAILGETVTRDLGRTLSNLMSQAPDDDTRIRHSLIAAMRRATEGRLAALLLATASKPLKQEEVLPLVKPALGIQPDDLRADVLPVVVAALGPDASVPLFDALIGELTTYATATTDEQPSTATLRACLRQPRISLTPAQVRLLFDYTLASLGESRSERLARFGDDDTRKYFWGNIDAAELMPLVARHVPAAEVSDIRTRLLAVMDSNSDVSHIPPLVRTMRALPGQVTAAEIERSLAALREAIGWARNPKEATDAAKVFGEVVSGSTGEAVAESVLEILKYPTAGGMEATDILSAAVRKAVPDLNNKSPTMESLLEWFADRLPNHLATTPRCPKPRGSGRSCPNEMLGGK